VPGLAGFYHVIGDHPVFDSLPRRRLADQQYGDVVPAFGLRVDGARTLAAALRPPTLSHANLTGCRAGTGGWAGADLLAFDYGAGEVLLSTFRLANPAGPLAALLLANLGAYVGGGESE
jgi:hypothetical protein